MSIIMMKMKKNLMGMCMFFCDFIPTCSIYFCSSKIYIRTKYAWYILEDAAKDYKTYFHSFSLQHQVLHELVQLALSSPKSTYVDFIQSMKQHAFTLEWIESDDVVCSTHSSHSFHFINSPRNHIFTSSCLIYWKKVFQLTMFQ